MNHKGGRFDSNQRGWTVTPTLSYITTFTGTDFRNGGQMFFQEPQLGFRFSSKCPFSSSFTTVLNMTTYFCVVYVNSRVVICTQTSI